MTKISIVTILLLTFSISAHATGGGYPPPIEEPPTVEQEQGQLQGQAQGQAQGQIAQSGALATTTTNVDASNSVDVQTGDTLVDVQGDQITYDFPSNAAYAPPSFSNIKCGEVLGAGYTNLNGSGSIGIPVPRWLSRKIRDCEADADANWLAEMGLRGAAIEARCGTRSMQDRFGGTVKGAKSRASACKTHLTGTLRTEAELEGLRTSVEYLSNAARALSDENRALIEELGDSHEAVDRCTKSWEECQAK